MLFMYESYPKSLISDSYIIGLNQIGELIFLITFLSLSLPWDNRLKDLPKYDLKYAIYVIF